MLFCASWKVIITTLLVLLLLSSQAVARPSFHRPRSIDLLTRTARSHLGDGRDAKHDSIRIVEAPVILSNPIWSIFSHVGHIYRVFRLRSFDGGLSQ